MVEKQEATSGIAFVLKVLTETMAQNDLDGGKTYDRMAENIRRESGSGLVREALGYVPEAAEDISACDSFRPVYRVGKEGLRKKKFPATD